MVECFSLTTKQEFLGIHLGKQELLLLEVLQLSLQEHTTSSSFSLDLELQMLQQTPSLLMASPGGYTEYKKHPEKEKAKASRK